MSLASRLGAVQSAGNFDPQVVAQLGAWLQGASDEDLFRTNPWIYAEDHALDRRTALDLFLHATHLGVLDFSWGILCPMCGSFITTEAGLRSLQNSHCHFCRIDVEASVDDQVEVAFTVSPLVRNIRFHDLRDPSFADLSRVAFSTSVVRPPIFDEIVQQRVRWQGRIEPGETAVIEADMAEPGRYTLNCPMLHCAATFMAAPGGTPGPANIELVRGRMVPNQLQPAAGPVTLNLRNRTGKPQYAALYYDIRQDHLPDPEPVQLTRRPFLTGKELVTSQTFRDLFRAAMIPSEGGLQFKNLTVLFTDLKDSTAMYGAIGDMAAYDRVRRHFDVVLGTVSSEGGAVVKTIGDAVMASFSHPVGALNAAAAMHQGMVKLGDGLELKIGMHRGPCIGVELNERLDYFGQTVNVAARVQGVAKARETVVTSAVLDEPGSSEAISRAGLTPHEDSVPLKGVVGETRIWRLS